MKTSARAFSDLNHRIKTRVYQVLKARPHSIENPYTWYANLKITSENLELENLWEKTGFLFFSHF